MKRIRFNQFLLRLKTAWRVISKPKSGWLLISLDKFKIESLLKGEDTDPQITYHRIQPYVVMLMIKAAADSQSDIDMVLMKAEFEAEAELFSKKSSKRDKL